MAVSFDAQSLWLSTFYCAAKLPTVFTFDVWLLSFWYSTSQNARFGCCRRSIESDSFWIFKINNLEEMDIDVCNIGFLFLLDLDYFLVLTLYIPRLQYSIVVYLNPVGLFLRLITLNKN